MAIRAGPVRPASSANQRVPIRRALRWTSTEAKLLAATRGGGDCCCWAAAEAAVKTAAHSPRRDWRTITVSLRGAGPVKVWTRASLVVVKIETVSVDVLNRELP